MPFEDRHLGKRRRSEVKARDGETVCALQITDICRTELGVMEYETRDNRNPRQFTIDHIVSASEAEALGWSDAEYHALDNLVGVCRACNREKSDGTSSKPVIVPMWINPRFAHLI